MGSRSRWTHPQNTETPTGLRRPRRWRGTAFALLIFLPLFASLGGERAAVATEERNWAFGAKLGVPFLDHAGEWTSCSASIGTPCGGKSYSMSLVDGVTTFNTDLSVFGAYRLTDWFRAGIRVGWIPNVTFADKLTNEQQSWGKAFDVAAELGARWPFAEALGLTFSGRMGSRILVSGGDLATNEVQATKSCADSRASGAYCTMRDSPYAALTVGWTAGIQRDTGPVRLTLELDWSYANYPELALFDATSNKASAKISQSLHEWYRMGLVLGVESR